MDDNQLLRYSRQIMLPQIDVAGQESLLASRALIIGAGPCGLFQVFELGLLGLKAEVVDSIRQPEPTLSLFRPRQAPGPNPPGTLFPPTT